MSLVIIISGIIGPPNTWIYLIHISIIHPIYISWCNISCTRIKLRVSNLGLTAITSQHTFAPQVEHSYMLSLPELFACISRRRHTTHAAMRHECFTSSNCRLENPGESRPNLVAILSLAVQKPESHQQRGGLFVHPGTEYPRHPEQHVAWKKLEVTQECLALRLGLGSLLV